MKNVTIMTNNRMKNILAQKLEDENTCFTKSDIRISKTGEGKDYTKMVCTIADYTHCQFHIALFTEEDAWWQENYGCYVVSVTMPEWYENALFYEWGKDINDLLRQALMYIGFYAGTRF